MPPNMNALLQELAKQATRKKICGKAGESVLATENLRLSVLRHPKNPNLATGRVYVKAKATAPVAKELLKTEKGWNRVLFKFNFNQAADKCDHEAVAKAIAEAKPKGDKWNGDEIVIPEGKSSGK